MCIVWHTHSRQKKFNCEKPFANVPSCQSTDRCSALCISSVVFRCWTFVPARICTFGCTGAKWGPILNLVSNVRANNSVIKTKLVCYVLHGTGRSFSFHLIHITFKFSKFLTYILVFLFGLCAEDQSFNFCICIGVYAGVRAASSGIFRPPGLSFIFKHSFAPGLLLPQFLDSYFIRGQPEIRKPADLLLWPRRTCAYNEYLFWGREVKCRCCSSWASTPFVSFNFELHM